MGGAPVRDSRKTGFRQQAWNHESSDFGFSDRLLTRFYQRMYLVTMENITANAIKTSARTWRWRHHVGEMIGTGSPKCFGKT